MFNSKFLCRIPALAMALLVGIVALCAAMGATAFAAEDPYAYTVRIYAGAQGSFDGEDYLEVTVDPTSENTRVSFSQSSVTLEDGGKYYVRGIKEAGRDNSDTLAAASFEVTEDADYVVAYGILGDNVAYTVRYVDAQGNELFPSEQFYGNVGDSPVLAYRYVEGYQPQAYNLTGQLLADASQNVYTFVYQPTAGALPPAQQPEVPEVPPVAPPIAETPSAPEAPAVTAPGGEGGLVVEPPAQPAAVINDEQTPQAGPLDVQDIRDDETPLASGDIADGALGNEASTHGAISETALVAAGAFGGAAVLLLLLLLLLRRRKDEEPQPAVETQPVGVDDDPRR